MNLYNNRSNRFNWKSEDNHSVGLKVLLFLLSPVLGLLYSLKSLNTRSTYIIIFLFCLTFGVAFTVTNKRTDGSIDGITYRAEFEEYGKESALTFVDDFEKYIAYDDGDQDFYFKTLTFAVSRFSSNYHVFFLFVALIFAFFQLRTLRFFTSHDNFSNSLFCLILFFLFTWNQIFNINGLRFWTAAWIAVYSSFQLLVNKNKSYLLLALLTPFVHGSYFLYLAILAVYYMFGRFEKLWTVLFLFSFIFSTIAVEITRNASTFLPDIFARKIDYYTDSFYISERESGSGFWFVDRFFTTLSFVYVNIMTAVLILKNNKSSQSDCNRSLLRFLIIWMCFANIFMPVPSVGGRFIQLAYPMISYLWLSYFSNKRYASFIYILPFVWLMNVYNLLRNYMGVLDWTFFVTSPIYQVIKHLVF